MQACEPRRQLVPEHALRCFNMSQAISPKLAFDLTDLSNSLAHPHCSPTHGSYRAHASATVVIAPFCFKRTLWERFQQAPEARQDASQVLILAMLDYVWAKLCCATRSTDAASTAMCIGVIIAFGASFELLVPQGFGIDLEAWRVRTANLPQLRTSRCTSIFHHMGTRKPANIRRGIGGQTHTSWHICVCHHPSHMSFST